jgi:hypothetical protein
MKKLTTIRKYRNKSAEQGFSLVIAAGFGLVIMMIGLTIMGRSIKDSSVSASQKTNNRSLAAAESGVTMHLSQMNKDPLKAKQEINPAATAANEWLNIVDGEPAKGQYKLISYKPISGETDKWVLTVEGRVNPTVTEDASKVKTAARADDISTGRTRVEAIIKVKSVATPATPPSASPTATPPVSAAIPAASTASADATTASTAAAAADTLPATLTASTANLAASEANETASTAIGDEKKANTNLVSIVDNAATAAETASNSAANATYDAQVAVANAQSLTGTSSEGAANIAANTAVQAAIEANTAASTANTAASEASTAASTVTPAASDNHSSSVTAATTTATTAATTATTAATTATTAAETASNAAALFTPVTVPPVVTLPPVTPTATSVPMKFPGLWLINGPNNAVGTNFNQSFNAYGLVTNTPDTTLWTSPGKVATQIEVPNSVSHTPPSFAMSDCLPSLPPSFANTAALETRIQKNQTNVFPKSTDVASSDGVYRYYANNLNLQGNTTVKFTTGKKVIVYLKGDMVTTGTIEIKPCDGAGVCNLNDLVIYGYKPNGQLLIKGTNTVNAFIVAPTYSAGVAGGGNGEGYKGALWAHHWTSASNSNKYVVNQNGNEDKDLACPYTNTIQVISQNAVPITN